MTWLMTEMGIRHCVGLCELPLVTSRQACRILGIDPNECSNLRWSYSGLNHRGFIDALEVDGRSQLEHLTDAMRTTGQTVGGVGVEAIAELNAIPLKYFRLTANVGSPARRETSEATLGRAQQLQELRAQLTSELQESVKTSPPSLRQRYMDWYPKSAVPLLSALCEEQPTQHMINSRNGDGLVEEAMATVQNGKWTVNFRSSPNEKVGHLNERFETHEHAFIAAMLEPSLKNVRAVFEADPIIPESASEKAAQTLIRYGNQ